MTAARRRALVAAAIAAGAAASPAVSAPARPAPPLVAPWAAIELPAMGERSESLELVDGPRAALIGSGDRLALVDLDARAVVGAVSFSSPSAPSPWPQPHDAPRFRTVTDAAWRWDATGRRLVGALTIWSQQSIPDRGFSRWIAGVEPVPTRLGSDPQDGARPLAISPDARLVVARIRRDTAVQVFDLVTGAPTAPPLAVGVAREAAFAPDGARIAVGSASGEIHLVDPATGAGTRLPGAHTSGVTSLSFAAARSRLATSDGETVRVWDIAGAATSTAVATAGGEVAFSPDGSLLAIASGPRLTLVDGATLQPRGELPAPEGSATFGLVAFTPDGRRLLAVRGRELLVYDLAPAARPAAPLDVAWFRALGRLPTPDADPQPPIERTGTIGGRVTAGGRPIAGATIELTPHQGEWPAARALAPIRLRAGADGRFQAREVPRIRWTVRVTAPRFQYDGRLLELRASGEARFDVALEPAATVVGIVRRPDGRPAAGARVTLVDGARPVVAGRDGRFVLDHLRPGAPYQLFARTDDGAVATAHVELPAARPTAAELRLLPADGPDVVRVLVVDVWGTPVSGAEMRYDTHRGTSDAHGRWTVPVERDRHEVRVSACRTHCVDGRTVTSSPRLLILTVPSPPREP